MLLGPVDTSQGLATGIYDAAICPSCPSPEFDIPTSPEGLVEGNSLGWTLSSLDGLVEGSALGVSLGCKLEASGSLLGAARLGS